MMCDTGAYSEGFFRDSNQIHDSGSFQRHLMIDNQTVNDEAGFTNLVTIETK